MQEKISRREFIKRCFKITLATFIFFALGRLFFNGTTSRIINAMAKRFIIPVKPFQISDLYKKHNLLG